MTIGDYVVSPGIDQWYADRINAGLELDDEGFPQAAVDQIIDLINRDIDAWLAAHRHELVPSDSFDWDWFREASAEEPGQDPVDVEIAFELYGGVPAPYVYGLIGMRQVDPRDAPQMLMGFLRPMSDN
jgi:hypothetical protein